MNQEIEKGVNQEIGKGVRVSPPERIHSLSVKQHQLREKLRRLMASDPESLEEIVKIRGQMMANRLGPDGLRALNTELRGTSVRRHR